MRKRLFISFLLLAIFLWMLAVNFAMHLLDLPSDESVVYGIVILIMSFIFFPSIITAVYRRLK